MKFFGNPGINFKVIKSSQEAQKLIDAKLDISAFREVDGVLCYFLEWFRFLIWLMKLLEKKIHF